MSPPLPKIKDGKPSLPAAFDGEIYQQVGKYARSAVLFAFQEVGGAEGLASWAEENKDDFYTKLFPKIIARESEVHHTKTVDQLADILDGDYDVIDAEDVPVFDRTDNGAQEVRWTPSTVHMDQDPLDMVDFDD